VGLQKLKVLDHGVKAGSDFRGNSNAPDLGLAPLELNALPGLIRFNTGQLFQEVQMPEGAAELPVSDAFKSRGFFLGDHFPDRLILGFLQLLGCDLSALALGTGVLKTLGTQQTANMVGPERGSIP
jgi:hypothetical protein